VTMGERLQVLAILAALILVVMTVGMAGAATTERVAIDTMVKLVFVIGLWVFSGNSGVLSFGHAAFAAIGAYGAAWLTIPLMRKQVFLPDLPAALAGLETGFAAAAAFGAGLAGLVALVFGIAVVRLSGIGASIASLALLVIVHSVYSNAEWLTKGTASLVGVPRLVGLPLATGLALAALVVAWAFRYSRWGLMLRASREDEAAAAASGIAVRRLRLLALVLSAMLVGVSGAMQGHVLGVLSVGQFWLNLTFLTLAMLVVGGTKSLSGAVVGTILIALVAEPLRLVSAGGSMFGIAFPAAPGLREVGLALVMLAVLIVRPRGLVGDREVRLPWPRR